MIAIDWTRAKKQGRRVAAAAPAMLAALGVAMAASSTPRPEIDRSAVVRASGSDLTGKGLTPAQLASAINSDPNENQAALYGLAGKPTLVLGADGLNARRMNAAMPPAVGALRPARPFVFKAASEADRQRAVRCLTQGIYYEAALESTEGQEAVAQVILNRVRDPNYANSICGVVFEGAERNTGCQFSFTCDGALSQAPVGWAWDRARTVALRMLAGHVATRVGTATHYHADYVHPWWSPTLAKITQIGAHIFYRWKGIYGETSAFNQRYASREPVIDEARFSRPRLMIASNTTDTPAVMGPDGKPLATGLKTVEIDGQTRVVGVVSLGGRRAPTTDEIAAINARMNAFEHPEAAAPVATPAPKIATAPGATSMAVEEVGKPVN
jgi:spore germination cell wall hydrolase CwlJ-like protein